MHACVVEAEVKCRCVSWLSITNEDKISLHSAGSHLEPPALREGPLSLCLPLVLKWTPQALNQRDGLFLRLWVTYA